jgi:hypothetical protein
MKLKSIFKTIVWIVVVLVVALGCYALWGLYIGKDTFSKSHDAEKAHLRISKIISTSYQKCFFSSVASDSGNGTYCYDSSALSFYSPADGVCFASDIEISKHEFTRVTLQNDNSGTTDYSCSIPTLEMAQAFVSHLNSVSERENIGNHWTTKMRGKARGVGDCCELNSSTTPPLGETYIYPLDDNLRVTTNIGDGEVYGWGFQHPVTGNAYATSTIGKDFSTNIIGKP